MVNRLMLTKKRQLVVVVQTISLLLEYFSGIATFLTISLAVDTLATKKDKIKFAYYIKNHKYSNTNQFEQAVSNTLIAPFVLANGRISYLFTLLVTTFLTFVVLWIFLYFEDSDNTGIIHLLKFVFASTYITLTIGIFILLSYPSDLFSIFVTKTLFFKKQMPTSTFLLRWLTDTSVSMSASFCIPITMLVIFSNAIAPILSIFWFVPIEIPDYPIYDHGILLLFISCFVSLFISIIQIFIFILGTFYRIIHKYFYSLFTKLTIGRSFYKYPFTFASASFSIAAFLPFFVIDQLI